MTYKFHFMTDKFHLMTEPTLDELQIRLRELEYEYMNLRAWE
jgi:hypothetical protein